MKTNVLVTGGAGFMGSHAVQDLLEESHRVIVLDDLSGGFESNVPKGAILVKGSVTDYELLKKLFSKYRFRYVFHMAAYAAEGLSHFIRRFNYTNNLIGSVNLINLSVIHGVKCFVFTSSIAVYGENQLPMTEDTVPNPEDPYGISKQAVELDLRAAHRMFGLNYIVFRAHNVYGERQNIWDMYRNVIGIFMNQIMSGKPLTVFGDGTQTRAFTYIRDISPIIARSVKVKKAYNQVFNLGADRPYTIRELAEVLCREFGVEPRIEYLPERNEVKHAYSSHRKLLKYFGYKPKYSLEQGIHRTAQWARKQGPGEGEKFGEIEVEKNMPPSWREYIRN
jgi:UDP-glucose 4-epimerase